MDQEENLKYWLHPADTVKVNDNTDETTDGREDSKRSIQVYTDGSKSERGVGAGVPIFKDDKITDTKNTEQTDAARTTKMSNWQYSKHLKT